MTRGFDGRDQTRLRRRGDQLHQQPSHAPGAPHTMIEVTASESEVAHGLRDRWSDRPRERYERQTQLVAAESEEGKRRTSPGSVLAHEAGSHEREKAHLHRAGAGNIAGPARGGELGHLARQPRWRWSRLHPRRRARSGERGGVVAGVELDSLGGQVQHVERVIDGVRFLEADDVWVLRQMGDGAGLDARTRYGRGCCTGSTAGRPRRRC